MLSQDMKSKIAIIIPSLSPDEKLIKVVNDLKEAEFHQIVVVNDGSEESYDTYFNKVRDLGCHVLIHEGNKGKGRALKTAYAYIKENIPSCIGAVTVDSDGQHTVKDITRCAEAMLEHPNDLILGCRNFKDDSVPPRSKFGNQLTCKVFLLFTGLSITDTQTGLRGIPISLFDLSLQTEGERFEYETNVLLKTKENNVKIFEVPISTIYIEDNKSSHFNPLKDSLRIYKLFAKFILSSISSFVIDIAIFTLLKAVLPSLKPYYSIPIATVGARIISSFYNYYINRKKVFVQKEESNRSIIRYYILVVIQMALSATLVTLFHSILPVNASILKMVIDCILFIFSFHVQREWVFK